MSSPAGPVEHSGPRQCARTLIPISAWLGCIATRCTSAAMSRNSLICVSLTPSLLPPPTPPSSCLKRVPSHEIITSLEWFQHPGCQTPTFSMIIGDRRRSWRVQAGWWCQSLPPFPSQSRLQTRPPPQWVYVTFSLEEAEKILTHRVINSIPVLEDSPRRPVLVQELPQAARMDQLKQAEPGATATNKSANAVSYVSQP